MKSFQYGYLADARVSHGLLRAIHAVGEFRGRQRLHAEQSPEVLDTLRRVAMIQSVESSNRIEGIIVAPERVAPLVSRKSRPKGRSEQEVAGYRDVLASIHAKPASVRLSTGLIREWHRSLLRYTADKGGAWKAKDNAILEVRPDAKRVVRFKPTSALATPKYMDRLVSLYGESLAEGEVAALLLIASFVLDFLCIHPFTDGNGRIGRLLALLLLYQGGYEVGLYISLERVVEESKETYYDALYKSSQGWHQGEHDLRPWWNYFTGMVTAAYKEFESRVGTIVSARGAKREMVRRAVERLPEEFAIRDLVRACPGISYPTLQRTLHTLRKQRKVKCLGRGPEARWRRTGR